jgi:hypothetical protein
VDGSDGPHSAVFHDISSDDRRRGMRGGVVDAAKEEVDDDDGFSQCRSWSLLKITSLRAVGLHGSIFIRCGRAGMELSFSFELSQRNESS